MPCGASREAPSFSLPPAAWDTVLRQHPWPQRRGLGRDGERKPGRNLVPDDHRASARDQTTCLTVLSWRHTQVSSPCIIPPSSSPAAAKPNLDSHVGTQGGCFPFGFKMHPFTAGCTSLNLVLTGSLGPYHPFPPLGTKPEVFLLWLFVEFRDEETEAQSMRDLDQGRAGRIIAAEQMLLETNLKTSHLQPLVDVCRHIPAPPIVNAPFLVISDFSECSSFLYNFTSITSL